VKKVDLNTSEVLMQSIPPAIIKYEEHQSLSNNSEEKLELK
jgi:hypothetical protein